MSRFAWDLECSSRQVRYQPIVYASFIAGLVHLIVFVWLNSLQIKNAESVFVKSSIFVVQLDAVNIGAAAARERSEFQQPTIPHAADVASTPQSPALNTQTMTPSRPAAASGVVSVPSPPAEKSILQQYLQDGRLPAEVEQSSFEGLVDEPDSEESAIFNPSLRKRFQRAQASRKPRRKALQQHYSLSSGDQFERQGDRCFVGRNMVSESGTTRIWYPTACPQTDTVLRALEAVNKHH